MQEISCAIITIRKEHPNNKKDLLNSILYRVNPKTSKQITIRAIPRLS